METLKSDELKNKLLDSLKEFDDFCNTVKNLSEEELNTLGEELSNKLKKICDELTNWEDNLLPNYRFVYMNSFKDVLVNEVNIDSIDSNKTAINFLNIIGVTKDKIIQAVDSEEQQSIISLQNKAVTIMTEKFKKIFSQVKDDDYFKISMTIDNKNRKLNFWIQNKITGESVLPFSDESEGMQWYLSMYFRLYEYFMKENSNDYYILLLDEPNIYLHAEAQIDLLENVFKKNLHDVQVLYSTHSPYMIDANDLFSLRIVDKDSETKVFNTTIDYLKFKKKSEKIKDIDVLSPVLLATGITISNQVVISPLDKIVVVEGPHDYYMLSAMREKLKIEEPNLKFIPCQGATKVPFMCSYLYGLGYNVLALLDNDSEGRNAIEQLSFENEDLLFIRAMKYFKEESTSGDCILEDLFSKNDKKTYMEKKDTVNYRKIYDKRKTIELEEETINNFEAIFKMIIDTFK